MYIWKMREMTVGSCSPAAYVRCAMMTTGSVFCFAMGREDSERKRERQAAAGHTIFPHFETEILYR